MTPRLRESYLTAYTLLRAQPNHPFARNLRDFVHAVEHIYPQETARCCITLSILKPAPASSSLD